MKLLANILYICGRLTRIHSSCKHGIAGGAKCQVNCPLKNTKFFKFNYKISMKEIFEEIKKEENFPSIKYYLL
jgi:hypothetical protein